MVFIELRFIVIILVSDLNLWFPVGIWSFRVTQGDGLKKHVLIQCPCLSKAYTPQDLSPQLYT